MTGYLETAQTLLDEKEPWMAEADTTRRELLNELRKLTKGEGDFDLLAWRRRLESLQSAYVQVYSQLHRRYVLDQIGDQQSQKIQRGSRVKQIVALSEIDILNRTEFEAWRDAITSILTCAEFYEALLDDSAVCPHCKFHPRSDAGSRPAEERLDLLDRRLDAMLEQWHSALRNALDSETALESIANMTPSERKPLDDYLATDAPQKKALPDGLAISANKALRGMQTISVQVDDLINSLKQGGLPCTAKELGDRFVAHIRQNMHGHDATNTRITIEE